MIKHSDIAIVGMSCIFPGAGDLNTYWNNIVNKVDAIQDAPESRISQVFYDPASTDMDRLYCNRGGFIDEFMDFDPIEFGIVPNTIKGTEPDHLLSLKLASRALEDARVFEKNISLEKAGIIIGRGSYGGTELIKAFETIVGGESLVQLLSVLVPSLSRDEVNNIKKKYQSQRSDFGSLNVMGTVPNLVASLVANRFNFGGPAYTVDAACASSIIAIDHAVKELAIGRCDIVVAGAIHVSQNPTLWSVFSLLGAFSKTQIIRPFDKKADGVLAGEGAGFVVLRKLKDAIKDDQQIYGVIKGVGVSSDGAYASLMSPAWQGQIKAIKGAWGNTSLDFKDIGYIEAHGTATLLGDKTELQTLKEAFPFNDKLPRAGIGSVKSMIGHAMPAAGMAGFIKTVMALHKGILPPTLHCEDPVEAMLETRFMPVTEAAEWSQTDLPFIAGVNAFGFGGANSHVVLEKFNAINKRESWHNIPFECKDEDKLILLARNSKEELISALKSGEKHLGQGRYRLGLFNPDEKRIAMALRIIEKDKPWRNKQDLWFTNRPYLTDGGKVAFIFPGLDIPGLKSLGKGNYKALANYFNLSSVGYYEHTEGVKQVLGLDEACRLIDASLKKLGILPDVVAGHSVGEYTACSSVGMIDEKTLDILNKRAIDRVEEKMDAVFLSANCGIKDIEDLLSGHPEVYLSNDNCTLQIVLCARKADAENFRTLLAQREIMSEILPFATGYHSPFMENFKTEVKYVLENIVHFNPPQFPIWSSITTKKYPETIEEIRQLHLDFITKPVLFRQLIENLYNDGVKLFIQIGAGSTVGFINNILDDHEFAIVSSGDPKREALSQIKRVLVALFIEGRQFDTKFLGIEEKQVEKKKKKGFNVKLDLSIPFVDFTKVFTGEEFSKKAIPCSPEPPLKKTPEKTILEAFSQNMQVINETQKEFQEFLNNQKKYGLQTQPSGIEDKNVKLRIEKALLSHGIPGSNVQQTSGHQDKKDNGFNLTMLPEIKRIDIRKTLEISQDKYPELIDHSPFRKRSITDNFDHEREPVVPLTMFIDLFADFIGEYFPKIPAYKIINLKVFQFLWVAKPVTLEITGKWIDQLSLQIEIDQYVKATILIVTEEKEHFPIEISSSIAAPISASEIYKEGYMFHGPTYQGICEITTYSINGIRTKVSGLPGKGAMMDNIGQTIGLFYHLSGKNILPFPVGFQELTYFQNPLDKTGEFECTAVFTREDDEFLYSDIELTQAGKRWCLIKGWQNRKSELDDDVWGLISCAENRSLARPVFPGISLMERSYKRPNTWFFILNQYLNASEIKQYNLLTLARQKDWLPGRIAAKDAIREVIREKTGKISHPASYTIDNDAQGKPFVKTEITDEIHISIAHKKGIAVAYASLEKPVGIDIEEIKEREQAFIDLVINENEKPLFAQCENKNEWLTRFWVAKEAYGKSLGVGLQGNPKRYTVSAINEESLTIGPTVIQTFKHENFIIGNTI